MKVEKFQKIGGLMFKEQLAIQEKLLDMQRKNQKNFLNE